MDKWAQHNSFHSNIQYSSPAFSLLLMPFSNHRRRSCSFLCARTDICADSFFARELTNKKKTENVAELQPKESSFFCFHGKNLKLICLLLEQINSETVINNGHKVVHGFVIQLRAIKCQWATIHWNGHDVRIETLDDRLGCIRVGGSNRFSCMTYLINVICLNS